MIEAARLGGLNEHLDSLEQRLQTGRDEATLRQGVLSQRRLERQKFAFHDLRQPDLGGGILQTDDLEPIEAGIGIAIGIQHLRPEEGIGRSSSDLLLQHRDDFFRQELHFTSTSTFTPTQMTLAEHD